MIKYFCDKCNRELENVDIFTVTVTPPEIRRWDDNARTGTAILCRECMERFDAWLEALPLKEDQDNGEMLQDNEHTDKPFSL